MQHIQHHLSTLTTETAHTIYTYPVCHSKLKNQSRQPTPDHRLMLTNIYSVFPISERTHHAHVACQNTGAHTLCTGQNTIFLIRTMAILGPPSQYSHTPHNSSPNHMPSSTPIPFFRVFLLPPLAPHTHSQAYSRECSRVRQRVTTRQSATCHDALPHEKPPGEKYVDSLVFDLLIPKISSTVLSKTLYFRHYQSFPPIIPSSLINASQLFQNPTTLTTVYVSYMP